MGYNLCCSAKSDSPVHEPVGEGPIPQGDFYEDRGSSHCLGSFVLSHRHAGSHIRSNMVYSGSGPIEEGEEPVVLALPPTSSSARFISTHPLPTASVL
ncbi:4-aminobutyrate aminotransferase, isoform CRA_b [Rattus norvegicus]|uniref:4-aminobutyrate aminotransferase, isoform CRA_b n=1 Tax=Rattus norvegicus TaxID=10116 RepID=A6K4M2_RAT|nr:4-aminobutyrate aminotransferase, isoform CRA_b [Rattus norvegicus]